MKGGRRWRQGEMCGALVTAKCSRPSEQTSSPAGSSQQPRWFLEGAVGEPLPMLFEPLNYALIQPLLHPCSMELFAPFRGFCSILLNSSCLLCPCEGGYQRIYSCSSFWAVRVRCHVSPSG